MKTIYDAENKDALATQGYKQYKDNTLKSMSKDDLIDQIRILEHNWAGEIKSNKLLSYRLKCFLDVLDKNGHPEKFSQICALPGEYSYIQALMNIAERRLCMCADPITREYMEALVEEIRKHDEDIAWSLVPQCVRCGGCVEPFGNCQYYNNTFKDMPIEEQNDVMARYDYYDNQRVKKLILKRKGDYNG